MRKYKFLSEEVILYGNIPEELFPEYEEVDLLENKSLPVFNFNKMRRDKILEKEGIITFEQLQAAYFLEKLKTLNKPRRIREYTLEKYSEIIHEYDLDKSEE